MKNLNHNTPMPNTCAWHQSSVWVSIETQDTITSPWKQQGKAILANSDGSDDKVKEWQDKGNSKVESGKIFSWRIVLTAEPQIHSFYTKKEHAKVEKGRVLSASFVPHSDVAYNQIEPPKSVELYEDEEKPIEVIKL